jgi:integrase
VQLALFDNSLPDNLSAHTWNDAGARWLVDRADKASAHSDRSIMRWLDAQLSGVMLADIRRDVIADLVSRKVAEGASNSTVNRHLALLRAVLNRAVSDWDWLAAAPKVRLLREPLRRVRYLTQSQANRLLRELPPHLSSMAAFSLSTGLRKSNVTGLEWSQVDLDRRLAWVHPDQAKARRAIVVPLNDDAIVTLSVQRGNHQKYVFAYKGKRIIQTSTAAWYKALRRAGISDFRWHDLRHTWASWHVQNETPLFALQELGGWESTEMVRRYAHLSAGHLAKYAGNLRLGR